MACASGSSLDLLRKVQSFYSKQGLKLVVPLLSSGLHSLVFAQTGNSHPFPPSPSRSQNQAELLLLPRAVALVLGYTLLP